MMPWTPEHDSELTRLFQQGFCSAFIATCLHTNSSDIRTRLQELGLKKPPMKAGRPRKSPPASAEPSPGQAPAFQAGAEEEDFSPRRGRPRGHLVSEAEIAARYRRAGRGYAGEFQRTG